MHRILALVLVLTAASLLSPSDTYSNSAAYNQCVNDNMVSVAKELGFDTKKKANRRQIQAVSRVVNQRCAHLKAKIKINSKCKKACRICSASIAELKKEFGTSKVPRKYQWAMKYVDAAGYKAYQACLNDAVRQRTTAAALKCNDKALSACGKSCTRENP